MTDVYTTQSQSSTPNFLNVEYIQTEEMRDILGIFEIHNECWEMMTYGTETILCEANLKISSRKNILLNYYSNSLAGLWFAHRYSEKSKISSNFHRKTLTLGSECWQISKAAGLYVHGPFLQRIIYKNIDSVPYMS